MITLEQRAQTHPDVVDTELEGRETVLLNLHTKLYYSLNATGTCIWQGVKQGLTLQLISQRLQKQFAVEAGPADHSVLALVDELRQQQLVQVMD